jgi:hypothetical protein
VKKVTTASLCLALLVPDDWRTTYTLARDCRLSPEHDLTYIRVFASPEAEPTYSSHTGEFVEGAVLMKEEFADPDCTDLVAFKVMRFRDGGWDFQRLDVMGRVMEGDTLRCVGCHLSTCTEGYMGTCAAIP